MNYANNFAAPRIDITKPLFLNDGTPVTKATFHDGGIQVYVPLESPFKGGLPHYRRFNLDGTRRACDTHQGITLTNTPPTPALDLNKPLFFDNGAPNPVKLVGRTSNGDLVLENHYGSVVTRKADGTCRHGNARLINKSVVKSFYRNVYPTGNDVDGDGFKLGNTNYTTASEANRIAQLRAADASTLKFTLTDGRVTDVAVA